MTIKEAYERLLNTTLPSPSGSNPNVSINCFCGGHTNGDEHESCSLNVENGGWYCHATGNKGYLLHAVERVKGVSREEAQDLLGKAKIEPGPTEPRQVVEQEPIDMRVRDGYISRLNADRDAKEFAQKKLGWNPETLREFGIGWSKETKRYSIPITDENGLIRNFRMYDPAAKGVNKMISWKAGYGTPARLFPMDAFTAQTIIVCEGEKDCILMNQVLRTFGPDNWAAVTGTGGASTFRDSWVEKFEGKDVIVIYDRDQAGISAAGGVASKLVHTALSVKVVQLDITEPAGADITNYFQDSGKGWDDLKKLIDSTEEFTSTTPRTRVAPEVDDTIYEPHLSDASDEKYAHKRLKLKVMVAGKELAPFIVPRKVAFECDMSMGKLCDNCSMFQKNGVIEHEFEDTDATLVEMVRLSKYELSSFVKRKLKINKNCPIVKESTDSEQNLEEVTIVPELEFSDVDKEYVSRTAYISKHGVQSNKSYTMYGTTIPHPRSQHAVHFMPTLEETQDSIDGFELDAKAVERLKVFQPAVGQSVEEKFEEIALDLSLNITKIYGRNDLIKAVELCYHTVLGFEFLGKAVEKTWGDILIIGDTRTGKTETVQSLIYHYKLGEMSMGENTSFAGLVGGLKQGSNRQWSIHWGRIPLNNRRLLVIDEMSGLPLEVISNMSGIRSNGVAEMVKIETQRTNARTRLIWLSNPRADKSMSQYGYGVEAVKELVGRPEDIARFDFVVTSATNEVPVEEINALTHAQVEHKYTSDLCRVLVLWAWSRKSEQIVFSDKATQRVLDLATEQSKRYVSDGGIPLVEGGNHRIKIAKLAVAAACRTFSTDDGVRVLVTEEHVQFAADFLDACYHKASLDYAGWSATRLAARTVDQPTRDAAKKWIDDNLDMAELWLLKDELRVEDFKTQFDLETKDARAKIFLPLHKYKMVERGRHSTYVKTPVFIQLLKEVRDAGGFAKNGAPTVDDDDDFPF